MIVEGKVAVVTGAGNGIGRQLALALLARGARVAAVDVDANGLDETARAAGATAQHLSLHRCDITDADAVAALADAVIARHGGVDALINNAGVIHPFAPLPKLQRAVIDRVFAVNLHGVVNMTAVFLPLLLERPVAHIANVSSLGGLFAFPRQTVYGASKAAVKVLSEGLYQELKGSAVGVTVVYPGATRTDITRHNDAHSDALERLSQRIPGLSPERVARRIVHAIETNRFQVTIGADAKTLSLLYRLAPRFTLSLVRRVMLLALPSD